jgi:hypothetical protein
MKEMFRSANKGNIKTLRSINRDLNKRIISNTTGSSFNGPAITLLD